MAGLFGSILDELGRAFEDIRHKVVEDGWFGRQVTDSAPKAAETLGWEMPRPSFDELWAPAEREASDAPAEPEREGPGLDL